MGVWFIWLWSILYFICGSYSSANDMQIFIQTGYPLDLPSGSLGSYCIYEYHMVWIHQLLPFPILEWTYTLYISFCFITYGSLIPSMTVYS